MKRVCKRKVMLDALTVCFEVENRYHYNNLMDIDYGDYYDMGEYYLLRIEGRYFDNVYLILIKDIDRIIEFGQLKFNIGNATTNDNKHKNGNLKAWITVSNQCLYNNELCNLDYIATQLGLIPHNVTTLDLCLDTPFCVSKFIKKLIKDKTITTILNGKVIRDRGKDCPEITYTISGSLNKTDKYLTVNVKQKNAIKDKNRGVTLTLYDKLAEVKNSSGKDYILNYYGNPNKLYRTEVHLNNSEIKDYLDSRGLFFNYYMIDEELLEEIFFHHLNSVIRFKYGKQDIKWEYLLGRA